MSNESMKIILIGDSKTGKTSIVNQYIYKQFSYNFLSTIGIGNSQKEIVFDNKKIILDIWDTAGQEKFRALTRIFYKNAKAVIIVYSITNKQTFDEAKNYWYEQVKQNCHSDVIIAIAANKCDLYENENVKYEEAEAFANQINAVIKETTATNHKQIDELVTELIKLFLNKKIERPHANSVLKKDIQKGNDKKKCC
jgi:small GTP-binding protein